MVKRRPFWARASRVGVSAAVSGSHIPAGGRPKREAKSRRPQRIWVCLSRPEARGRIMWL